MNTTTDFTSHPPSPYSADLFMPTGIGGTGIEGAGIGDTGTEGTGAEGVDGDAGHAAVSPPAIEAVVEPTATPTPHAEAAAPAEPTPREWVLEPGEFAQLPDRAVQELWFELRTWSWKSLAIVPTVLGASELDIAEKLVVVGVSNTNRRMSLISAEGVTIGETDRLIAMIRAAEARGDRVLVATDSIQDNPAAAPIIRAVNGAILSVRMGVSDKAMVERTIATINRNRVIGVVTRSA